MVLGLPRFFPWSFAGLGLAVAVLMAGVALRLEVILIIGVLVVSLSAPLVARRVWQVLSGARAGARTFMDRPVSQVWNKTVELCIASGVRELSLSQSAFRARDGISWRDIAKLPPAVYSAVFQHVRALAQLDRVAEGHEATLHVVVAGREATLRATLERGATGDEEIRLWLAEPTADRFAAR
jgi:hypothetical protein